MTAGALVAIVVLVLVNGFFVAAEFALVSLRPDQLPDTRVGQVVRHQSRHLDEYLSACQLGITIASLALGALGEPTIANLLEPLLGDIAHVGAILGTVAAILIMTSLHITAGEQAPKSFAIGSAVRVAALCALPLEIFYRSFRPLVRVLNAASNGLVRAFGGTPTTSHAESAGLEELRRLIRTASSEEIDAVDRQLLQGVFTLDERTASDVMTPRPRVVTVHASDSVQEALTATRSSGHSRFPVLDEDDRIVGLVLGRDLTGLLLDGRGDAPLEEVRRTIAITPPTQRLDRLLGRLRAERASIAAVVDEYGVLDGVVTIEDIVEELVGEIWDEDDREMAVRGLPDGSTIVAGDVSLADLASAGFDLGDSDSTSIGGLIQDSLGRVPTRGDRLALAGMELQVLATHERRVRRVLIRPVARTERGPPDDSGGEGA